MSELEIIGLIASHEHQSGEPYVRSPEFLNPEYIQTIARAHEAAGFDAALVGWFSSYPDGLLVAQHAAAATERLGFLIAHRPGFLAPSNAARAFATLDRIYPGRIKLHVISGGSDEEQRRDGDWLSHRERYERTEEFVQIVKALWGSNNQPVDFDGRYYQIKGGQFLIEPEYRPNIPVFFGGASDIAVDISARYADVYATFGEDLQGVAEQIGKVRNAAAKIGRKPGFSVSFRPIVADTEAEAWDRAHELLANTIRRREELGIPVPPAPTAVGSQRLRDTAAKGSVLDERLFTGLAAATSAGGNINALVGTATQVADALLEYHRLGASTFILRGFDSVGDAEVYGRELLPQLRERARAEKPQTAAA